MTEKPKISMQVLDTTHGPADIQLAIVGANVQLNAFLPPNGGASFFLLFPASEQDKALEAARTLLEGEPLPADQDITSRVPGAIVAGTVRLPTLNIEFGIPTVEHAPAKP